MQPLSSAPNNSAIKNSFPLLGLSHHKFKTPRRRRKNRAEIWLKELDNNAIDEAYPTEKDSNGDKEDSLSLSDAVEALLSGTQITTKKVAYDQLRQYDKGRFKIDPKDIAARQRPSPAVHLIYALQLAGKGDLIELTLRNGKFDQTTRSGGIRRREAARKSASLKRAVDRDTSISLQSITAKFIGWQATVHAPNEEEKGQGHGAIPVLDYSDLELEKRISHCIPPLSQEENEHLAQKGFTPNDVLLWATILSDKNAVRAARSLVTQTASLNSTDTIGATSRIPLFVLNFSLRRHYIPAEALRSFLHYTLEYIQHRRLVDPDLPGQPPTCDLGPMDPSAIFLLFIRLLRHSRMVWPAAIVEVTSIITDHYLSSQVLGHLNIVTDLAPDASVYITEQCNVALHLLSLPTSLNPMDSAAYQQRAQFDLIRKMAELKPSLPVIRLGHRALTSVLLRMKKTPQERDWARLKAPSWPPFRISQTRLDDAKGSDYGKSRAGRALDYMQHYGYPLEDIDFAMKIMSGFHVDGSPTIQTREIVSGRAPGSAQMWAAMVTSTRTLPEAWACFLKYKESVKDPHGLVYHAMFKMIIHDQVRLKDLQKSKCGGSYDRAIDVSEKTEKPLPGDGRETLPASEDPTDAIYVPSDPPSLEALFDQMIKDGVVIEQHSRLLFLMLHAPTFNFGLKVWAANTTDTPPLIKDMSQPVNPLSEDSRPQAPVLHTLPPISGWALTAFVGFLCRFPTADTSCLVRITNSWYLTISPLPGSAMHWSFYTRHPFIYAYVLLKTYKASGRPAWLQLISALGRSGTMENISPKFSWKVDNSHPLIALVLAQHIVASMNEAGLDIDVGMFQSLCNIAQNAAFACHTLNFEPGDHHSRVQAEQRIRNGGQLAAIASHQSKACPHFLRSLFSSLVSTTIRGAEVTDNTATPTINKVSGKGPAPLSLPTSLAVPNLAALHAFIRALALYGDFEGIYSLVRWMVRAKDEIANVAAREMNGTSKVKKCLLGIRALLEDPGRDHRIMRAEGYYEIQSASEELIALVRDEIESVPEWGGWPTDEQVELYYWVAEDSSRNGWWTDIT